MKMNGREVFKHAVRNMAQASKLALEANGFGPDDVAWVLAHQANLRIIEGVSDRVGIPLDRFYLNVDRYGNTSSASVPTALDEALELGKIKAGDLLLMTALGGGWRGLPLWCGGDTRDGGDSAMTDAGGSTGRMAFLFPGQGSQQVGMGKALSDAFPRARAVFDEADTALGFSLSRLCFEGPEADLVRTANAQPAILATSIAAFRVLEDVTSLRPAFVAGHSLGEYSALVSVGSLGLADAVRVVHLRGRFMQDAVPEGVGAMAALLGIGRADVEAACEEAMRLDPGEVVSPANLNGGGQIVIAGHRAAVGRACEAAKRRGAKRAVPLAVSAPFHSALMQPAADRLAVELARIEFRDPQVPVVTNVDAAPNIDGGRVRDLLTRQVTAAVRWEESIQRLAALGVTEAIEVGHGAILAGLVKRIAPTIRVRAAGDPAAIAALTAPETILKEHSHA